jgi:hypothetical protein
MDRLRWAEDDGTDLNLGGVECLRVLLNSSTEAERIPRRQSLLHARMKAKAIVCSSMERFGIANEDKLPCDDQYSSREIIFSWKGACK